MFQLRLWLTFLAGMRQGSSTGCYCVPAGTEWGHHGSIQTHFGG